MPEDTVAKLNQARNAGQAKPDEAKTEEEPDSPDLETNISAAEFLLIGGLAAIKDFFDVIATLSIIGVIFTALINLPVTLILWLWCIMRLKRFPTAKFLGTMGLEFIPFLGALPLWTGFVVSLWLEQTGHLPKWLAKRT